jgi:hypothetical protein
MFGMGRHEVSRSPAFDPLMTVVLGVLLLVLAFIVMLAGS